MASLIVTLRPNRRHQYGAILGRDDDDVGGRRPSNNGDQDALDCGGLVSIFFTRASSNQLLRGCPEDCSGAHVRLIWTPPRFLHLNWDTETEPTFRFQLTPMLVGEGLALVVVMGLVGGLIPMIELAQLDVVQALGERTG